MAKIISRREYHEETYYRLEYNYRNSPGSGYSFDCDKNGIPTLNNSAARENYRRCVEGIEDVVYVGQKEYINSWYEPAILQCNCGNLVDLYGFTNTCDKCGRDYNSSGQELAPREQWGWETGESLSEILSIQ